MIDLQSVFDDRESPFSLDDVRVESGGLLSEVDRDLVESLEDAVADPRDDTSPHTEGHGKDGRDIKCR